MVPANGPSINDEFQSPTHAGAHFLRIPTMNIPPTHVGGYFFDGPDDPSLSSKRLHMEPGIPGVVLAAGIVIAGLRIGIEAARVNPPEVRLFGLASKRAPRKGRHLTFLQQATRRGCQRASATP